MGRFRLHLIRRRKERPFLRLLLIGFLLTPVLYLLLAFGIEAHPDLVLFALLSFAGCFLIIWILCILFLGPPSLFINFKRHHHDHAILRDLNSSPEQRSKARIRMRPKLDSPIGRISVRIGQICKLILLIWIIVNLTVFTSDLCYKTSIAKNFVDWFSQVVNGSL